MNQTPNYKLNQWEADDRVQRTDFNADNAKIDAAIHAVAEAKAEIVTGSYIGDGQEFRTISLGFTPRAVLVLNRNGRTTDGNYCHGGLALIDYPVLYAGSCLEIVEGGFQVSYGGSAQRRTNYPSEYFYYLALR